MLSHFPIDRNFSHLFKPEQMPAKCTLSLLFCDDSIFSQTTVLKAFSFQTRIAVWHILCIYCSVHDYGDSQYKLTELRKQKIACIV